ncbi:MerR family transcriptional regulator [Streptomyces sp. NPDC048639]|uniref:MerR family transcriptional regulator n=1 Tax=Streptomyces sp. NPDC048639 TaxID=3365581 RepID=UPI0037116780
MRARGEEQPLTIGELAERFGLRHHELRHWEATGLLDPAHRVGRRRQYTERHVAKVALIVRWKAAGFNLEQLRSVLDARGPDDRHALLRRHHRELEDRIRQVEASKELIEHALECSAEDFTECPEFRRLVERM